MHSSIPCDVLVIGGGAAAIRAAIEAGDNGAHVIMATQMKFGYGGSSFYIDSIPWGIMTAGGEEAKEFFLDEIISASCGCLDKKLVEILVGNSDERFKDLLSYGIKFRAHDGTPCFGTKPRGALLISIDNARKCFKKQIQKRNIKVIENLQVHELVVKDNICYGAVGIDNRGEVTKINAKTVVLASGGAEYLWKYGFALPDMTGDAYAMAARHGARLTNLEFIQFIPGVVSPLNRTNFYHPTLGSIPKVTNSFGEEFLRKYLPADVTVEECLKTRAGHGPFSCEDNSKYFDIAIYFEEIKSKSGKCQGAQIWYTDSYYNDAKNQVWRDFLEDRGVDTKFEPLRVYPHCQGFNGGVLIDQHCMTDIENLYACGECAGGPHGANRIGGNAILGTQVFGKIAGENAAKKSKKLRERDLSHLEYTYMLKGSCDTGNISKLKPEEIMISIKEIMQESAFIVRDEAKLKKGIDKIEEIEKSYNPYQNITNGINARQALGAYNSLLTSRLILYSMFNRKESRGSHYRSDYPDKSNEIYGDMAFVGLDNDNNILIK